MSAERSWTSASDLADYAYCPRSHWYHEHPPDGGPSSDARARAAGGQRYHARTLGAERRRAEHGAAYWGALLVGVLLVLGGIAWILHP
ncbi:MAG TPA: hypothetical protein VMG14_07255 [Thermoplasmata archaeon]|nr:hypothetical protein [Thermoplasmata archaeon]